MSTMSIDYSASKVMTDCGTKVTHFLPHDHSKAELEAAMKLVFTALNAVTIDHWNQNTEQNQLVLSTVAEERAALLILKRLIKGKKQV